MAEHDWLNESNSDAQPGLEEMRSRTPPGVRHELRPLTTGEVLDRTFFLYRSNFWLYVGLSSIAAGVSVLASIGRLTYLGALGYATPDGPGPRRHNSAQRLASLWDAIVVPDELRAALKASDGPVLLIDDQIDTGWTMTVAAALLRDADVSAVLPLALATTTG